MALRTKALRQTFSFLSRAKKQFLDLSHLLHCLSDRKSGFGFFFLDCLRLHVGLFQQPLGFMAFVLDQIPALCVPSHSPVGMLFLLVGHQFPLDRLVGSHLSDLALVVGDGPAQLTRIPLSRAILPQGSTRRCRHLFAGILSLTAWVCCFSRSVLRLCGTGWFVVG